MPTAHLTDRALVVVSGAEAEHLLQNILTTDLDVLAEGEAKPGALLTPQGKILFDYLISRDGPERFRLECRADVADDFVRRLMLYKLRAKVEIGKQAQQFVAVSWQNDSARDDALASAMVVQDMRFPEAMGVMRRYGSEAPVADADPSAWHALRVRNGVPESGSDYQFGDAFPHDVLLDQMGGVGFRKGCYVGQEVVSRMQHRGTARRRVLIADAESDLPPPGTAITAGGRAVGALGSVSGQDGLALVRIDRAAEAMREGQPILAGDVPVRLEIPEWANFTFPNDAPAADEA